MQRCNISPIAEFRIVVYNLLLTKNKRPSIFDATRCLAMFLPDFLFSAMSRLACSSRCLPPLRRLSRRCISRQALQNATEPAFGTLSTSEPPAPTKVKSHRTLPAAKMRALVSLYHQADSWITPENLLQKIDDAFVPTISPTQYLTLPSLPAQEGIALRDLTSAANQLKTSPKMAQLEAEPSYRRTSEKGLTMSKREKKMFEALYGVKVTGLGVLPGLEVLEEMKGELKKHRERDKEDEEGMDVSDLIQ